MICSIQGKFCSSVTDYTIYVSLFVCKQEHWFTIRRIQGEFWNFNSLFPAPQPLSLFYLSTFLATLREQGYTIFVVRGALMQQPQEEAGHSDNQGAWFTPAQVCTFSQAASATQQNCFIRLYCPPHLCGQRPFDSTASGGSGTL